MIIAPDAPVPQEAAVREALQSAGGNTDPSCAPCVYNAAYWGGSPQCNNVANTFTIVPDSGSFWPFAAGNFNPSCFVNFVVVPLRLMCSGTINSFNFAGPSVLYLAMGGTNGTDFRGEYEHWMRTGGNGFGGYSGAPVRTSFGSYFSFGPSYPGPAHASFPPQLLPSGLASEAANPFHLGNTYSRITAGGGTGEYTNLWFSMELTATTGTLVVPWRANAPGRTTNGQQRYTWTLTKVWY